MAKETVIRANSGFQLGRAIKDVFRYKDLLLILAGRDFKVRYAQTFLGLIWGAVKPAITLGIFIIVFNRVAKVESGDIPYPLFAMSGLVAWSYFSFVIGQSGSSLINSANLIKKVYFPRLVIPISKALLGLIDFGISFVLLLILFFVFGIIPEGPIYWLPVFIIFTLISGLGIGLWVSALSIRYRDFVHIVPFMVQIGQYASPIAYPSELLGEKMGWILYANPMAGIIDGFRWSILGGDFPGNHVYSSMGIACVILLTGILYFGYSERKVADIL